MNNTFKITALGEISTNNVTSCHLIIPGIHYIQLSEDVQSLFTPEKGTSNYYTDFKTTEGATLIECIIAFCEVTLVMGNSKYEISDQTNLQCELFKIVKSAKDFSMLINIQYPNSQDIHHDILTFKELDSENDIYTFQLLGDKSMFRIVD